MTTIGEAQARTPAASDPAPRRPQAPNRRRITSRVGWQIALYALLILIALVYIYPFLVQIATSFKTDAEARSFVNQLTKQGIGAFTFTSDAGQVVEKLSSK